MNRLLFIAIFVLASALPALATGVTVSGIQIPNWTFGGSTASIRIYPNKTFVTSTGVTIIGGKASGFYKTVSCTVASTTVTCPSVVLDSTTDSSVNTVRYIADLYDSAGRLRARFLDAFRVPPSPTKTTWEDLRIYNGALSPILPPTYQAADQAAVLLANKQDLMAKVLTHDYSNSLATAVTEIGATQAILTISTPTTVSASLTIPSNITLKFENTGLITVAASQTLTIGSMQDPGVKKLFNTDASSSAVRFSKGSVPLMRISWWAGVMGTSVTGYINQMLASVPLVSKLSFHAGTWTTAGGHTLPSGTIIEGEGMPNPGLDGGTIISAVSPSTTYLFRIAGNTQNFYFSNIGLWGNLTGVDGILMTGADTSTPASGNLFCYKVYFYELRNALYQFASGAGGWQMQNVRADHSYFIGNTDAGWKSNSANGQLVMVNPFFIIPKGGDGIDFTASGPILIMGGEMAGAGKGSNTTFIRSAGSHGQITIVNIQDEAVGNFLVTSGNNLASGINIIGGGIQSVIDLGGERSLNLIGGGYYTNSIIGTSLSRITMTGTYTISTEIDGTPVVNGTIVDPASAAVVLSNSNNISNQFEGQAKFWYDDTFSLSEETPVMYVGRATGINRSGGLFVGRGTSTRNEYDFGYHQFRKHSDGQYYFVGNQVGFIGYNFDGPVKMPSVAVNGGKVTFDQTITPSGTTGNRTINKAAGSVNIAAGNASVTITNSLVTTTSLINVMARTNDAACSVKNYVPAVGSFTVNMTANCTAETSVGFIVH